MKILIIWAPRVIQCTINIPVWEFSIIFSPIYTVTILWCTYLEWLFISFRLAVALCCVLHGFASPFPRGISNKQFLSQAMATYLCTSSQVLYSHCQCLYKEKEPAHVVSILKKRCGLLIGVYMKRSVYWDCWVYSVYLHHNWRFRFLIIFSLFHNNLNSAFILIQSLIWNFCSELRLMPVFASLDAFT